MLLVHFKKIKKMQAPKSFENFKFSRGYFFGPALPIEEKTSAEHPWSRYIKDAYFNKIKYAHNSIRNPEYPKKTIKDKENKKVLPEARDNKIKFTIFGDRVTKEFIHCVHLVKGLHKYRKDSFDPPAIYGTNTVEWPTILSDLKVRYRGLAYCLTSSVAVIKNDEFFGGESELTEFVNSNYSYHLTLNYCKEAITEFAKFIRNSGRACAYMNIAINSEPIGTLIFMLYDDILPNTSANFLRLCQTTKGGYPGTPIHRIVKDGWIQGGGYGLKETNLDCENFVIPHDRRGVLGMANSGINMQCSTQFFVLLQPAPWMAKKFVAFGQLVEGKETLDKIEAVPCFYESPNSEIIIYKAGIFNMDCQDIMINRGANEYIDKHIDDLNDIADIFYEELMEKVFLTVQLRELERLKALEGEGGEQEEEDANAIRETMRFNRRKEDIEQQLQTTKPSISRPLSRQTATPAQPSSETQENQDFDVESYEYEESDYTHTGSIRETTSSPVRSKKPFYIPLTDVKYPEEKDSQFDLKRFLQGDYCLESDLIEPAKTFIPNKEQLEFSSSILYIDDNAQESDDEDSGEEKEMIKRYLKNNIDRMSFAGSVVKSIGKSEKAKSNIFADIRKSELISDDRLRRIKIASKDLKSRDQRMVSISMPQNLDMGERAKIKRRTTGFVRPDDLEKIHVFQKYDADDDENDDDDDDDDEDDYGKRQRKVRISQHHSGKPSGQVRRRPTAFVHHPSQAVDDDDDDESDDKSDKAGGSETRQSVLVRLFDEVAGDDEPPTLKDFRPTSESRPKSFLLFSSNYRIKNESDDGHERYYARPSLAAEHDSTDHVLSLQHGSKMARKISSDYVKTIDHIEHRPENSIRSVEFAKTRPTITIQEYQAKNRTYFDAQKKIKPISTKGMRLPGDSPLYSDEDTQNKKPAHHRQRKSRSQSRSRSVPNNST